MFAWCYLISQNSIAQEKSNIKFGKVNVEDFNLGQLPNVDTASTAVIIADIGSTEFEGNKKGWFTLVYKRFTRIKIINRNGVDAATISIPLYQTSDDKEKLEDIKAVTYNLDNGKLVETKLNSADIFEEKIDKNYVLKKFTLPAVKEGSVIEITYKILSDFDFNLQHWYFQSFQYPTLWSEYKVNIPDLTRYMVLKQGRQPFHINKQKEDFENYIIWRQMDELRGNESQKLRVSATITKYHWVMKDVPALKQEKFTASARNYISKIEFQLAQIAFPGESALSVMDTWLNAINKLLLREDFGNSPGNIDGIAGDILSTIISRTDTDPEKARKIYEYVRDNFTCTNYNAIFMAHSIKNVFKNKNGSVAEINLILAALLKHENIAADPVILSTRDHGVINALYPILDRFNYVICRAKAEGKTYYLDATRPMLGFGKLPVDCYNGPGRVINSINPDIPEFKTDQLTEESVSNVSISMDGKNQWVGSFQKKPGYYQSYNIRREIAEKGESSFFKRLKSLYNFDIEVSNESIDSLKKFDAPVNIHYDFGIKNSDNNVLYFSPMMNERLSENPFGAVERIYPVEMPYLTDENYTLRLQIPESYEVDELPKSDKFSINNGQAFFEYKISKDEKAVYLHTRLKTERAVFLPGEYKSLRDFYATVINKQNEQIVFKKKK